MHILMGAKMSVCNKLRLIELPLTNNGFFKFRQCRVFTRPLTQKDHIAINVVQIQSPVSKHSACDAISVSKPLVELLESPQTPNRSTPRQTSSDNSTRKQNDGLSHLRVKRLVYKQARELELSVPETISPQMKFTSKAPVQYFLKKSQESRQYRS